jgi:hypothetical protein
MQFGVAFNSTLWCILPMLETWWRHWLNLFKGKMFLNCNFMDVMKLVQVELYWLYVDLFCNVTILIIMIPMLFVNIVINNCPSPRFYMILMLIFTYWHTWHLMLVVKTMVSIIVDVLTMFMFMWIWLRKWRLHA